MVSRQKLIIIINELLFTTNSEDGPKPGWLDARKRAVCAREGKPIPPRTVSLQTTMEKYDASKT